MEFGKRHIGVWDMVHWLYWYFGVLMQYKKGYMGQQLAFTGAGLYNTHACLEFHGVLRI